MLKSTCPKLHRYAQLNRRRIALRKSQTLKGAGHGKPPSPRNTMSKDSGSTQEINVDELCSYAVDVWVSDHSILTDEERLLSLLRTAAEKGEAQVLGESSHVFPNGAVT